MVRRTVAELLQVIFKNLNYCDRQQTHAYKFVNEWNTHHNINNVLILPFLMIY